MKYALICPNEPIANGYRVAQVEAEVFPVGEPTYWLECSDDVVAGLWYFDTSTQQITIFQTPIPTAEQNKTKASNLLSATDWTTIADVSNPQLSDPYLANQNEFIIYRNSVRNVAVYPVAGNLDWPTVPTEVWIKP